MHFSKEEIQKEIIRINSKPKQFLLEREQEKLALESSLASLKQQWKNADINSQEYLTISQKITELRNQLKKLELSLYNPKVDDKLLADLEKELRDLKEVDLIVPTEERKDSGIIKDFAGTHLNLSEKISKDWNLSELTIENCPNLINLNLKRFSSSNLADEVQERWMGSHNEQRTEFNGQLTKLIITNCENLSTIDASCNNLVNDSLIIDGVSRTNLVDLDLHNNKKLTTFDASLYPQLVTLNLDHCNLASVDLKENSKLKNFFASGNKLTKLDFYEDKNRENHSLVNLNVNNNRLRELKVKHLKKLESLYIYENELFELDCENLTELRRLACARNNFRSLKPNKDFNESQRVYNKAFFNFCNNENETTYKSFLEAQKEFIVKNGLTLHSLNIDGCKSLELLDIDSNGIEKNNFSNFLHLEQISLMYNGFCEMEIQDGIIMEYLPEELVLSNNPKLKYLNYYGSNYSEVQITDCPKLVKGGNVTITPEMEPNQFLSSNGEINIVNNKSASAEIRAGQDDPRWGEEIIRYQAEQENQEVGFDPNATPNENEEEVTDDPSTLSNTWPKLAAKHQPRTDDVNIAGGDGRYYTGTLVIDNWQTDFIDVGNNHFSYLVVKNCQNLKTLIYAHNSLKHDAWIDWATCPNLRPENVRKENYDGREFGWNDCYDNHLESGKIQEQEDKGELPKEEKQVDQQAQILAQIILLLEKAENALAKQDYSQLDRLIKKIQELVEQVTNPTELTRIQEQIARLEQTRLAQNIASQPNYWPLIIGSIGISLLTIGLMFWFINKQIKKIKYIKS